MILDEKSIPAHNFHFVVMKKFPGRQKKEPYPIDVMAHTDVEALSLFHDVWAEAVKPTEVTITEQEKIIEA